MPKPPLYLCQPIPLAYGSPAEPQALETGEMREKIYTTTDPTIVEFARVMETLPEGGKDAVVRMLLRRLNASPVSGQFEQHRRRSGTGMKRGPPGEGTPGSP